MIQRTYFLPVGRNQFKSNREPFVMSTDSREPDLDTKVSFNFFQRTWFCSLQRTVPVLYNIDCHREFFVFQCRFIAIIYNSLIFIFPCLDTFLLKVLGSYQHWQHHFGFYLVLYSERKSVVLHISTSCWCEGHHQMLVTILRELQCTTAVI